MMNIKDKIYKTIGFPPYFNIPQKTIKQSVEL